MASRFQLRIGAAILGASAALLATALPASAETHAHVDERGDVRGLMVNVVRADHRSETVPTTLIGLQVDGGDKTIQTYCVELSVSTKNGADMAEVPWNKYPDEHSPFFTNASKVNWILQNSYPAVQPTDLAGKVAALNGKNVTKEEAIAATQAAIWHYSDGADLDADKPVDRAPADVQGVVKALYTYLTGPANTGIKDEAKPSLDVSPKELSGKTGDKIGPFTIQTTAQAVQLTKSLPAGAELVDRDGNAVKDVQNGSQVFVKVPADARPAQGGFTVSATARLEKGRLFVGDGVKTQSLIVAAPVEVSVKASATAKWVAAPATVPTSTSATPTTTTTVPATPTTTTTPAAVVAGNTNKLANTGASVLGPVIAGVVLLGAGVGALLLQRRRKRA
ncbi:thioester domain-containing protein [Gandjariella thermophila]|uniref:TQXA domain-containing protein n=1 Tax=Gandjariella thermophila TaxID=1931992 RepID=A0A4D4JHP5_9PSEU|nr:thioester domain-containing protein [Gandjariella thermophila]GDY33423.1 TQXA domain-containing protein [Gandjariella thermophila]